MINPTRFIRLLLILIVGFGTLFMLSILTSTTAAEERVTLKQKRAEPITIIATIKASKPLPKPKQKPVVYTPIKLSPQAIKFLGDCESGNDPTKNTGNGYYGAFQFTIGTWNAMQTGYARADLAPYSVQVQAVHKLLSQADLSEQFPDCTIQLKNAGLI